MKIRNCRYAELADAVRGNRIVVFGMGAYFRYYVSEGLPESVRARVSYFVDNEPGNGEITVWGKHYQVYDVAALSKENNCVILIASSNYMLEMTDQLLQMDLPDSIVCYAYGLIMSTSVGTDDRKIRNTFTNPEREERIPRKIHTFWFSKEEKPEEYRRCIDSWQEYCPDYEFFEWNCDNYDYKKNPFMEDAINQKKWAFASDYARLDVIWKFGGIYMDADMELCSSIDRFLGNKAFFTFDTANDIDLCIIASERKNPLMQKLLHIYDNLIFNRYSSVELCQPRLIRNTLAAFGVKMDGNMQMVEGNIFLPRIYFSGLDEITYRMTQDERKPLGIHHANAGWKEGGYREKRIKNNRELMRMIEEDYSRE